MLLVRKKKLLVRLQYAVALSLVAGAAWSFDAVAEEDEIEEVVVTGSLIKRDNFDSSSPVQVLDDLELQAEATPSLGEILANQTFNYGSDTYALNYARNFQEGNSTSANLRGLGERATLTLLDGKRAITNNLNNFIPQIAIERIDILKDGASALYGSDAVAGVVNIIPKKKYEGAELGFFRTQDSEGDHNEQVFNMIFGGITDNGHFTFAAEYRDRTQLMQTDRPDFLNDGVSRSGTGNPGQYIVPVRDNVTGLISGKKTLADPGCGVAASPGGNGNANAGNLRNNISGTKQGEVCRFQFGEFFNFVNPNDQLSAYSHYEYQFNDRLVYNAEVIYSRQRTEDRGSPTNPGGRINEIPTIAGEHPGNPYRAMTADGQLLFAADADNDGIADRDAAGVVILAADPFDAATGIAFNEDVTVASLRLFGKLGNLPTNLDSTGANLGAGGFEAENFRLKNSLSYSLDNGWDVQLGALWSQEKVLSFQKNSDMGAILLGFEGRLGENGDRYYNPFSTSALNCVNRVCTDPGAATNSSLGDYINTQYVADQIDVNGVRVFDTTLMQLDMLATGDLFKWNGNEVAGAFGLEYRETTREETQTADERRCNNWINQCRFDWKAEQEVLAAFFELAVPLFDDDNLGLAELQLAGRYTDYASLGSSFDPKIAALWQPKDWLSIRGSYSTAFIVPSLTQLYAGATSFLQTTNDVVQGDREGTFRTNTYTGNPALSPEEADVFNVGFSLVLLDGDLNIGVDYANYDFTDRVARTTAQQVINADFDNFLAKFPQVDSANPSVADSTNWIQNFADPAIVRGPGPSYTIVEVRTTYLNAQSMEHTSIDLYATYDWNTEKYGSFRFGIDATHIDKYEYDLGNGTTGDGVGLQNDIIAEIPPLAQLRLVGTVNWSLNNHAVLLRARWNDEIEFDSPGFSASPTAPDIESLTYLDLTYSLALEGLFGGESRTNLEIGARNITDEYPDVLFTLGGIETFVHDPRGRTLFGRIRHEF